MSQRYRGGMVAGYAHCVERGHRIAVSRRTGRVTLNHVLPRPSGKIRPNKIEGRSAGFVEPRPYMRRAFDRSVDAQLNSFSTKFADEVQAETESLPK